MQNELICVIMYSISQIKQLMMYYSRLFIAKIINK